MGTSENQLALTAQALESWGNKRASWGKTHNGRRFTEIYEEHASYVDWISTPESLHKESVDCPMPEEEPSVVPSSDVPAREYQPDAPKELASDESPAKIPAEIQLPANSWTSAAVSISGPRYQKLSEPRKAYIRKLHHNLGHPTAERLAKHLKNLGAEEQLVQGALDYLCAPCAERRPPKLNPPATLKEARDFNQRIYIDGFDWKSNSGYQGYVVHMIDEATQFHLGRRTVRDGIRAQKVFEDCWSSWAGSPGEVVMDCGGEFIADPWKEFLQR
eukprot:s379_g12.t1